MKPASERFEARVFAYNPETKVGYARLSDNRIVWLNSQHLVSPDGSLFPGDNVEFDLERSEKGLEGRGIRIIAKEDEPPAYEPVKIEGIPSAVDSEPELPSLSTDQNQTVPLGSQAPIPPGGTHEARRLYQKAALARTEGRIGDARRFFRLAVEAGGGPQVYEAFFKMEMEGRARAEARSILEQAIGAFPDHVNFYVMYGHMERRARGHLINIFLRGS